MATKGFRFCMATTLMCLLLAAPGAFAALTCPQVNKAVSPCLRYVTGKVAKPPISCCNGVKDLNSKARTKADRKIACECLKKYAGAIKGIIDGRVKGLPGACGVKLPFTISRTTNCNNV